MAKQNDGGPAFPISADENAEWKRPEEVWDTPGEEHIVATGMSLRDYFAAVALRNCNHQGSVEWLASEAYRLADAMLAARKAEE